MKILPEISKLTAKYINISNENYTLLNINENIDILYKNGEELNKDILEDLIERKGYATTLLYLNETSQVCLNNEAGLLNESNINDFYNDCEELLTKNIKIVEEVGIPLVDINGYKIFESDIGILRGNGKKKICESFEEVTKIELKDLTPEVANNMKYEAEIIGMSCCPECKNIFDTEDNTTEVEEDGVEPYSTLNEPYNERKVTYSVRKTTCPYCEHTEDAEDFSTAWVTDLYDAPNGNELVPGIKSLEEDGTQCSDIAPKVDQNMGINKPNKKYYDILISDINESEDPIINKGFFKNSKGQYERNSFILVKEGEKYLAIRKDKLL